VVYSLRRLAALKQPDGSYDILDPTQHPEIHIQYRGSLVNKADLIDAIASAADINKSDAGRALDAVIDSITDALKRGDQVSLVGFRNLHGEAPRRSRGPQPAHR
jgi:DNA-binding protein HU-beta